MCDEYDSTGNLIRRYKRMELKYTHGARILEERYFKPDGTADYRYAYVYASNGMLSEKRMTGGEARDYGRWVYSSEGGRIISADWFNERGDVEAHDTYSYSADGRAALRTRENIGEWRHEYDKDGREIRVSGGAYSGAAIETIEYEYDGEGHILKMEQRGPGRCVITFVQERL